LVLFFSTIEPSSDGHCQVTAGLASTIIYGRFKQNPIPLMQKNIPFEPLVEYWIYLIFDFQVPYRIYHIYIYPLVNIQKTMEHHHFQ
jgi:hypothetical protein